MVLVKKEILEQRRTNKILILAILFLFVAISSPVLAKLTPLILKSVNVPGLTIQLPDPTFMDSMDQYIKNISQLGIFVLVFLVAGAIAEEKTSKTLEMILTKPISRVNFILSKFSSYFITISSVFILTSLLFYFYTVTTLGSFSFINFCIVMLCSLLYILMIVYVTIFFSTVMKNTITSAIMGFVFIFISSLVFSLIEAFKPYSPSLIMSNYKDVIVNGFSNDLIKPIIVCLVIILISIVSSIFFFRKQEVER